MFILEADWCKAGDAETSDEIASMADAHRRYYAYVEANRALFPAAAYELAVARWRHNFSDNRALHGAWVDSFRFVDASLPEGGAGRVNGLELILLGAYHNGRILIRYRRLHSAKLILSGARSGPVQVHRDEIRLSGESGGRVLHEIEFLGNENWLVDCEDMEQSWEPFTNGPPAGEGSAWGFS